MLVLPPQIGDDGDGAEMGLQRVRQALHFRVSAQQAANLFGGNDAVGGPGGERRHLGLPFGAETFQPRGRRHALPRAGMEAPENAGIIDERGGQQGVVGPARTARVVDPQRLQRRPLFGHDPLDGTGPGLGQADMQGKVPLHGPTLGLRAVTAKPHPVAPTAAPFPVREASLPRFGDARAIRIGLLGGSFNPAHAGHLDIVRAAMRRLRLQQVWLLVSPGNPLKPEHGMAPLPARLASARGLAAASGLGARVIATDIERHLATRFTNDTLRALRRRFPRATFIWLMGADNLVQLPRIGVAGPILRQAFVICRYAAPHLQSSGAGRNKRRGDCAHGASPPANPRRWRGHRNTAMGFSGVAPESSFRYRTTPEIQPRIW